MRFLGPAALTAASLVLVVAADGGAVVDPEAVPAAVSAAIPAAAPVAAVAPAPAPAAPPASRPVPPWKPVRRVLPDLSRRRRDAMPGEVWSGAGFDACNAPSLDALRAWHGTSPYGALGVYTSGSQRACDQARLTADWVRQARAIGWKLIPTHVGLQAPCATSRQPQRIDPAKAVQQGRDEAATAVRALQDLGFGKGSPVFLDIESYARGDASCSQAVIDYTQGWTQALHRAGYHAGYYSSTDSGVADLAAAARAGSSPLPDAVWYAGWDDRATVTDGAGALGGDLWSAHGRIHQHRGNSQETYGGATLTIDRDRLDTFVGR